LKPEQSKNIVKSFTTEAQSLGEIKILEIVLCAGRLINLIVLHGMVFSVTVCPGGENGAFYPLSQNVPLKYLSPTHKILAAAIAILQSRQSPGNVFASNLTEVIEREQSALKKLPWQILRTIRENVLFLFPQCKIDDVGLIWAEMSVGHKFPKNEIRIGHQRQ